MSAIDAVIARSRQPGQMQTRKRFTVARKRAIQKMRKFALADPYHYILELIQSAIANGAAYVDVRFGDGDCTVAYIGGGLHENELAQLFDFLFASKDRTDVAHVRTLAMGLNAALRFSPTRIVVESGSQGMGTTRMELNPQTDEVSIGKPQTGLVGTYVRIEGMDPRALGGAWRRTGPGTGRRETEAIETRCLTAPVPISINGQPTFGFGTQRIPRLPGYRKRVEFDEGDLYGVLGIDPSWGKPNFALLTYGVHIQSKVRHLTQGKNIGGIICFDALRKTVDHSGIVEDDRYEEMFARLAPYVRQLLSGAEVFTSPYEVRVYGHDRPLEVRELRELLVDAPRIVWTTHHDRPASQMARAQEIAERLDAPLLLGKPGSLDDVRKLAGADTHFVRPKIDDDRDLQHARKPELRAPRRPWLAEAQEASPLPLGPVIEAAAELPLRPRKIDATRLSRALGETDVSVVVYTPRAGGHLHRSRVELRHVDRVFSSRDCDAIGPGHVVVAEFPELSVGRLRDACGSHCDAVFEVLVDAIVEAASSALDRAADEVVRRLIAGHIDGAEARGIALHRLSHGVIPRLDMHPGTPTLDFVRVDQMLDLAEAPLFRTLDGGVRKLSDLEQMAKRCEGLLYGVSTAVPADLVGIDRSLVLDLDASTEAALESMLGHAGYVRIDARDILVEVGPFCIRDRAFGLGVGAAGDLAWEGEAEQIDAGTRAALVEGLFSRAFESVARDADGAPMSGAARAEWEVCPREAAAHLRRYLLMRWHEGAELEARAADISAAPLFSDSQGFAVTPAQLRAAAPRGVQFVYGDPNPNQPSKAARVDSAKTPLRIRADAFTARALSLVCAAVPATGTEVAQAPAAPLVDVTQQVDGISVRLWLAGEGETPGIDIVAADGQREVELSLASRFGLAGAVRLAPGRAVREALSAIVTVSRDLWRRVVAQLRREGTDHAAGARLLEAALELLARNLEMVRTAGGQLRAHYVEGVAAEVARLPLFTQGRGGAVSFAGLVHELARRSVGSHLAEAAVSTLADGSPSRLEGFLHRVLDPARVVREQAIVRTEVNPVDDDAELARRIHAWIDALRPDELRIERVYLTDFEHAGSFSWGRGVLRIMKGAPLVSQFVHSPTPPHFARLLISAYAFINAVYDEVTAEHELAFQRAVSRALRNGSLDPAHLPVGAPA